MNSSQPIGEPPSQAMLMPFGYEVVTAERIREMLLIGQFNTTPICVVGDERTAYWAEVFEREAMVLETLARFLVHLVVPGDRDYIFTLNDLPDLLQHIERLAPVFAPLLASEARQSPQA